MTVDKMLQRLDELCELEENWNSYGSKSLDTSRIWLARTMLVTLVEMHRCPVPYLYPTNDGGLRVEWTRGPKELSLELDLTTFEGYYHVLDTKNDRDYDLDLDMSLATNFQVLAELVNNT